MDTGRPTKTLADYLVIAVSPALIMVLVHSLCFFLVDIFYQGEALGGVRWVLFWFVLAVVLITRIGIEQGDGQAMLYGILLALVTWLYMTTLRANVVFGALLLGIVWFAAHKITSSCTLIDEDADASGQGLLQSLWNFPQRFKKTKPEMIPESDRGPRPLIPAFSPGGGEGDRSAATHHKPELRPPSLPEKKAKPRRAQTPGVWLIYFSLAALPVFGLGQTLLPADDLAARQRGFVYLFLYLTAALGLLMTTSFLGLRRYLRQRYLNMPSYIAFGWVQFGAIAAIIVLCLSLFLPRPGAGEAWGKLRHQVDHQLRRASEYAARFNPHGSGSGRSGNQAPANDQQANPPPQPGQSSGTDQNQSSSEKKNGEPASGQDSKQGKPGGSDGQDNPLKSAPSLSPSASAILPWLKTLFWLAAAIVLGWLFWRYRVVIGSTLLAAWAAIRKFIADLLGLFQRTAPVPQTAFQSATVAPFKTFKNPFITGGDRVWPPEKLIAYSYDALQSWVLESAAEQGSPKTPREFCRQLGEDVPDAANALEHLAFLYGHVAYGASIPGNYDPEQLRALWQMMAGPKPVPSGSG